MFKSKILIVVSTLAASGAVFAGDRTDFPVGESTRSRAEVRAELEQARAWNMLPFGELGQSVQAGRSSASRAQVAAEAAEAQRLELIAIGEGNARMATTAEQQRVREAGQRAIQQVSMK
ncbi:MAG TPA: DUF4148 domain-containing protein [Burkholderiaceae bacterium]|nr:DUF4148 domain-containing protein [Burkholderiaceae bacterium]